MLARVDLVVLQAVQGVSSPALDTLAGVLNYVAAGEVVLSGAGILTALLWRRGLPLLAAAAPLLFLLALPIELVLKFTLDQPVPSEFWRQTMRYELFTLPTMQSYPSGHALRSAFAAVFLGYLVGRWGRRAWTMAAWIGLGCLAVLSAWCRVYQGQHWPSDVVGGALLGASFGLFAVSWLLARRPTRP